MTISEKVAYLKGVAEGLNLESEKSKEAKLISIMMDILEDVAMDLEDLEDVQEDLSEELDAVNEELDAVSEDLSDVEDIVYEDEDDEDYDDDEDEEEDCYASVCPNCGDEIYFDDSILEAGEVVCPGCGQKLNFDLSSLAEDEPEEED